MRKFLRSLRPSAADLELAKAIRAYPARGGSAVVVLPKTPPKPARNTGHRD
ncbi:MAG: hypothetical protein V9G19_13500 [Tetrasphaera sp.]